MLIHRRPKILELVVKGTMLIALVLRMLKPRLTTIVLERNMVGKSELSHPRNFWGFREDRVIYGIPRIDIIYTLSWLARLML